MKEDHPRSRQRERERRNELLPEPRAQRAFQRQAMMDRARAKTRGYRWDEPIEPEAHEDD